MKALPGRMKPSRTPPAVIVGARVRSGWRCVASDRLRQTEVEDSRLFSDLHMPGTIGSTEHLACAFRLTPGHPTSRHSRREDRRIVERDESGPVTRGRPRSSANTRSQDLLLSRLVQTVSRSTSRMSSTDCHKFGFADVHAAMSIAHRSAGVGARPAAAGLEDGAHVPFDRGHAVRACRGTARTAHGSQGFPCAPRSGTRRCRRCHRWNTQLAHRQP